MADETDNTQATPADHIAGPHIDTAHDKIEQVDLQLEMQRSYLDYAMSVIVGRALTEGRDGSPAATARTRRSRRAPVSSAR